MSYDQVNYFYGNMYPIHYPKMPYPMNFVQAPSFDHQILISYGEPPCRRYGLQGLSTNLGPVMFPTRNNTCVNTSAYTYPLNSSTLDPFMRQYIADVRKVGYSNY